MMKTPKVFLVKCMEANRDDDMDVTYHESISICSVHSTKRRSQASINKFKKD